MTGQATQQGALETYGGALLAAEAARDRAILAADETCRRAITAAREMYHREATARETARAAAWAAART